ncbi:MAG: hypothetical protein HOP36_04560 [Methyloglobulus sp.]|nr:hypothetical protein [Methyloglobulus sp.]
MLSTITMMFHFILFGMEAFEAPEGTPKIASAPHNHLNTINRMGFNHIKHRVGIQHGLER